MDDEKNREPGTVLERRDSAPPEPVKKPFVTFTGVIVTVAMGVVALGVLAPGMTRGAPRSARVKWEKRAAEIDAAIALEDSTASAGEIQAGE